MAERQTLRSQATACALSAVLTLGAMAGQWSPATAQAKPISEQEAHAIGVDAYLYFYPLVTMDLTRRQMTNVPAGKELGFGPPNTFNNVPAYPSATDKVVVRPNFDTLYSVAWLDLTKKGCSTVSRRVRMASGFLSSLSCTASTTSSCSHRVMRRSLPVVH
jgi:hypothetical protein